MKIAISGKLRSGKDTIGKQLIEMYGFEEFKFSSGITKLIQDYFPSNVYSKGKLREHYQTIGQSIRGLDENVWIRYTHNQIQEHLRQHGSKTNIVITDLRQQNEANYLRENGFTIIKVEALSGLRVQRAKDSGDIFNIDDFNHETELSVDHINADYVLDNNGTLEDLTSQMNMLMMSLCYRELVSEDPFMNSIREAASKALEESFSKMLRKDKPTMFSLDNSHPRLEKRFYNY